MASKRQRKRKQRRRKGKNKPKNWDIREPAMMPWYHGIKASYIKGYTLIDLEWDPSDPTLTWADNKTNFDIWGNGQLLVENFHPYLNPSVIPFAPLPNTHMINWVMV